MDYKQLKQEFNTPFYIYNFDFIKERFLNLKEAFKARKSQIFYAVKANSNLSLLQMLANLDSGFDCVSIGEVKRALKAGAKAYKIIFSGVGKTKEELRQALEYDILYINLESEAEMMLLESVAKELNLKARISIRVNPNVDAKTHPYISTGLNENKFGVEIDIARKMYLYAKNSSFLEPVGVHFHIGSQLLDISPIHEAAGIVAKLVRELKALQIDLKFFDIGGGLGVAYEKDECESDLYDYAQGILAQLHGLDLTIGMEPGRYLVAKSGEFVCSVLYEKQNKTKRFVVVDGAMNDLIRPSLYEAYHEIILPYNQGEESLCDVVGGICESGDFFAKARSLPST
ncbi:TPA: diaminopimelate decarboxylase, partial [Campylobacter jejuni]|nr:diaminopimelate decarboxylase [Campylobacter jejuni]